ncbi:TetR/AcrR family transcriptional regulator [Gulosibacter molinativorax]|uniref:TetR/AcrR family transcriptional regulator n=1 Tax=Gulosibacter molinativorax TaxID=256821 RepID=A0ABT7C5S7_9MICO|nr:TetR/AcrR family transcriptional regulator [Gulosibacter molinativorax]MDJ1370509.1 TetR/AcrR family transcriptional regulator [Gulosibacter molinativorax]QUY62080.1 HTH-type transcriptional regulator BetI [Gulosibacter molinativorax]
MTEGDGSRNTERTRTAILAAARELLTERGTATTLQQIAEAAGISKSGLLHHFANKNELLRAVLRDYYEGLQAAVRARVDLSENYPGKALRAYVHALCGPDSPERAEFASYADFSTYLEGVPGIDELNHADTEYWREFLAQDGLDPDRIAIVRYAAEGLASASAYDEKVLTDDLPRAYPRLLRLTLPEHPEP